MRSGRVKPRVDSSGELNRKEAEAPLFLRRHESMRLSQLSAASAGIAAAMLVPSMTGKARAFRAAYLQDPASRFTRHSEPRIVPDIALNDADGRQVQLSDWRGQLVLLQYLGNLVWHRAKPSCLRWIGCKRNSAEKSSVLALSTDRGGPKVPAQFFSREGITHLKVFNDDTGEAAVRMKEPGLPLSIVLNEDGQEIARLLGPMEWDSAEIIAQLGAWKSRNANGRAVTRPSLWTRLLRALDFDFLLGADHLRPLRKRNRQNTLVEPGFRLVLINRLG